MARVIIRTHSTFLDKRTKVRFEAQEFQLENGIKVLWGVAENVDDDVAAKFFEGHPKFEVEYPEPPADPDAHNLITSVSECTVTDLEVLAAQVDDVGAVIEALHAEQRGNNRKGAVEALERRIAELEEDDE